jgi:hypothetical protein
MSRKVGGCSSGLERKLVLYTLSAAGAVAFTPPAGAQVIYTATNLLLTGGTLPIDLNHDGVEDFSLINREYANFYYSGGFLAVHGNARESPAVLGQDNQNGTQAFAVPLGFSVGSYSPAEFIPVTGRFGAEMAFEFLSYNGRGLGGHWVNVGQKFLGFRFSINNQVHYGWARLSVDAAFGPLPAVVAKLSGYAYESTPGKSIPAGYRGFVDDSSGAEAAQSGGSLGMLSLGAAGANPGHK